MFDHPSAVDCTKFSPGTGKSGFRCRLLVLLTAALLVLPLSSAAQTTQTLSLDAGWNLVSLHVQPDDSSFASIFDGAVSMAKNEEGDVYLPGEGIKQISTWRSDEGYKVYAETPTTLNVSGSEVPTGATAIELDEGWNVIPYLPVDTQAVEKALVFIEESLVVVEDEDGTQYDPSASSSPLDSLRPGEGYKVYVDRADTLRYPKVTQTLDDALSLTGTPVGSYVRVQGYHKPGDGGGGLFRVTGNGTETDGGTVFVFNEDVSTEQTYTGGISYTRLGTSLPDSNLVWGTVKVEGGSLPETAPDDRYFHGHAKNVQENFSVIDYKNGAIGGGGANNGDTVRYKYATSNRRLERVMDGPSVSLDWWGAVEADPNNPVNNWWRLAWAINKAHRIYQNSGYEWAYVDIPGEYYFRNNVRIREGVMLRGASDQTFGQAANGQPTYGKLTMMPGRALYNRTETYNNNKSSKLNNVIGVDQNNLGNAKGVTKVGIRSLELDGNIPNNTDPFDNRDDYVDIDGIMQQGNEWVGFRASNGLNSYVPDDGFGGGDGVLQDVYIHDWVGGNMINGFGLDYSKSENIRLGEAGRNHIIYRTLGTLDGMDVSGGGWASLFKVTRGTFTDFDYVAHPVAQVIRDGLGINWSKVFDHHGKGFGLDWKADSDRISKMNITVDGFSIDLSQDPPPTQPSVFNPKGYGGTYKNGTIKTATPGENGGAPNSTAIVAPVGTGNGPVRDYTFESIEVISHGTSLNLFGGANALTHNVLQDITIKAASGVGANDQPLFNPQLREPVRYAEKDQGTDIPLGMASRARVTGIDVQQPQTATLWRLSIPYTDPPLHEKNFIMESGTINNQATHLLSDRQRGFKPEIRRTTRLWLSNMTFRVPGPTTGSAGTHKWILDNQKTIRLRNCDTQNGRVSDASGSYTSDASDEGNDYVLIPTSLMSLAQERTATVTSGNRSVQSVENADANGNVQTWDPSNPTAFDPRDPYLRVNLDAAIQAGNTITIDWTAKVTPTEDYQTTGVHVARPVANQSYTSGSGPFTIDLRGVAFSQETDAPIQYSVSSGNTSVVTATVNSYEDPNGNQIPWELELTEQSAGTATITVDAEIPDVGTAQTTFEVTVE
jgi:hypothetical protein